MSVSILYGPWLSPVWKKAEVLVSILQGQCLSREAEMPVPIFRSSSVFFRSLKLLVVSLFIESSGCFTVL